MSGLPENTILGQLSLGEVYVRYDGPKMFTANALSGQTYFVLMADEDSDQETWLYMPVSTPRSLMIRSGGIELNKAFREAEGVVYVVYQPLLEGFEVTVHPENPKSLMEDWLPRNGLQLNFQTDTLPSAKNDIQIEELAHQELRTRVRIEVELGVNRTEAPIRKIAELLLATQNVYDNLGLQEMGFDLSRRQRIPPAVLQQMQSEIVEVAAASFMIELASSQSDYVFGESAFSKVTGTLLDLLNPELVEESLFARLSNLQPRGARSFRAFVDGLEKTGGDIQFISAGMSFSTIRRILPHQRIVFLKEILHYLVPNKEFEIRGRMRLFLVNYDGKKFGLHDQSQDQFYRGSISEEAHLQLNHAEVNELYDVVLSVYPKSDSATGETIAEYVLDNLTLAHGGAVSTKITEF